MAEAERVSLQILIEDCAVSCEKMERKGKLDLLPSLEDKYIGTASTILKAIEKIEGLETRELDPF